MSGEQWRPVPGWEGAYEVSDRGRVRSLDRRTRRGAGWMTVRSRVLKTTLDGNGRRTVKLHQGDGGVTHSVYRVVMDAFVGPCPPGMEVCHGDGDKTNDALSNLRYDTRGNNNRDAVRHGTHHEARKTRCPQNHPYDEANTYVDKDGHRFCRTCRRDRIRAFHQRKAMRAAGLAGKPGRAA